MKKEIILFLSLAAALACAPWTLSAAESKTAEEYLNEALGDIQHSQLDEALNKLGEAIRINDRMSEAYFHRGMILSEKGDRESALRDFEKAVTLDPDYAPPYLGKGAVAFSQGNLDAAVEFLTQAIDRDPELGLAYYNRGVSHYYQRDLENAESDLTRAKELGIEVEPELYEEVWTLTHLDTIIEDTTKTLAGDDKNAEAYYNRGIAYYYKKDNAKALEDLKKARELGAAVEDALMAELQPAS
ncbi:MAG: tetratricopeptide repeat protein [Candidatus Omnitrophota bacterium]|jgi:tetratricopeptide (TPR) repeat protein